MSRSLTGTKGARIGFVAGTGIGLLLCALQLNPNYTGGDSQDSELETFGKGMYNGFLGLGVFLAYTASAFLGGISGGLLGGIISVSTEADNTVYRAGEPPEMLRERALIQGVEPPILSTRR